MTPDPALDDLTLGMAPAGRIGVAVSGGGDSVALLLLLREWALEHGRELMAVTIDHGLRADSNAEAVGVERLCASVRIAHETLRWNGWTGRGNLQSMARDARRALISDWASRHSIKAVALGHTLDDQAETFLLRLARGSGVDGLSAMRNVAQTGNVLWLRPMLSLRRDELRHWLRGRSVAWVDDPSNDNVSFDRVRARQALEPLAALGIGAPRLAATAAAMSRARDALEAATGELAAGCLKVYPAGDAWLDPVKLVLAAPELRLRLLATVLMWVAGATYRPRLTQLEATLLAIEQGRLGLGATLHGCVLRSHCGGIAIRREPARASAAVPVSQRSWDARWQFEGELPDARETLSIGALGSEGLACCPDWREQGVARETLLTTPALWDGPDLRAAPFARGGDRVRFRRISAMEPHWLASLLR